MASCADSPRDGGDTFSENDGSEVSEFEHSSEYVTPERPPKPRINAIYREVQEFQENVSIKFDACLFNVVNIFLHREFNTGNFEFLNFKACTRIVVLFLWPFGFCSEF